MSDRAAGQNAMTLLEKREAVIGDEPVGALFAAKTDDVARAFRMLKRDMPGENPMCWKVAVVSGGEAPDAL